MLTDSLVNKNLPAATCYLHRLSRWKDRFPPRRVSRIIGSLRPARQPDSWPTLPALASGARRRLAHPRPDGKSEAAGDDHTQTGAQIGKPGRAKHEQPAGQVYGRLDHILQWKEAEDGGEDAHRPERHQRIAVHRMQPGKRA